MVHRAKVKKRLISARLTRHCGYSYSAAFPTKSDAIRHTTMREDELHVEDCVPGCVVLAQAHPWPWWAAVVARHPDTGDFKDTKNRRWIYFFNDTNGSWQHPRRMMRFTPFNVEHMLEINERFKRNHQVKDRIEGSLQLAREFLQGEVAPTENLQRFNANLTPNSIADEENNQLVTQNGNVHGNGVMYDDQLDEVEEMDIVDEGEQTAEEQEEDEREDGNGYNAGVTTEDEDGQEGDLVREEGNEEGGEEDNADEPHDAMEEETLEEGRMGPNDEQQQEDDDENNAMDVDVEPEEDGQKSEGTTPKKRNSQTSEGSIHTETDVPRNAGVSHAEVVGVVDTDEKKGSEGSTVQEQEDTGSPTDVTKPVEDANGEVAADPNAPQTAQASNADEAASGIRHRSKRKRMKSTKLAGFVDPTVSTRQRRSIRTKSKTKGNDNTSSPGMTPERMLPSPEVTMEEADGTAEAKQDSKRPCRIRLKLAVTPEGVRTVRKLRGANETNEIQPDDAVVIDNLDEEVAQVLASETQKRTMLTRAQVAAAEAAEKNVEEGNDEEVEDGETDEIENQNITTVGGKLKIKVKRNALKESVFQRVKAVKGKGKQVPGVARGGVAKRGAKVAVRLPTRQTPPRKARAAAAAASAAQAAQARARGKAKTVTPVATKKRKQVATRGSKRLGANLQEDQVQVHVPAPEQPPPVAVTRPRKRPRTHLTSYRAPVQLAPAPQRENEGDIDTESENDEDVERLRRAFIDPGDSQQVAEMNVQLANRVAVLEDHMKRVIERQDAEEPKKATGASMAAVQLKTAAQMLQVAAQAFARENDFDPERTARALDMVWPDEEVRPKGFVSQNVMVASKSIVWDEQTKGRYRKQAREKQRQKEAQERRESEEMANSAAN